MSARLRVAGLGATAVLLAPRAAAACASCVSSAYGDRTYNWAYLGLLAAPFFVAVVVAGVLAWIAGYRPHTISSALRRWRLRRPVAQLRTPTIEERT